MPVDRLPISRSQLCELLGIEPSKFIAIEREPAKREHERHGQAQSTGWVIVTEGEAMQTRGTIPALYQGKGTKKPKGKGGKKC